MLHSPHAVSMSVSVWLTKDGKEEMTTVGIRSLREKREGENSSRQLHKEEWV